MSFWRKGDNIQKNGGGISTAMLYAFLKYFTFRFELTGLVPVVTSTSFLLSRIRQYDCAF